MRKFLICVMAIGLSVEAYAVANCFASATTAGANTTAAINTTGASILIMVTSGYTSWPIVSDSAGNVWQTTATYNNATYTQIWFAVPPVTSASHTFTLTNNGGISSAAYPTTNVYACSGTLLDHPYSAVNGLLTSGAAVAFQSGSVTPFEAGDLIIAAAGTNNFVITATINSGFNTPIINNGGGFNESLVSSWLSAPNTSALNPTWTTTVSAWSGINAVFKASTATAPSKTKPFIKTVAGDGGEGYIGNGPALSARFDYVGNVVITSLKLVCFADVNNNIIRCYNPTNASITQYGVTIPAGNVGTIAGTPPPAVPTFIDNVPPLSAGMIHPVGLAIDSNDCMYVADQQSAAIRKFCTTGNMTTIAGRGPGGAAIGCSGQPVAGFAGDGGPATSALLQCPQGVTVNLSGTIVYAADSLNARIRAINLDSITHVVAGVSIPAGDINTIFGSGGSPCGLTGSGTTSVISYPLGIKLTAAGTLVVSDFNCQNVVRLTSAGVPSLVAGNGTAGYVDGAAASAEFNAPFDVEIMSNGDILIADANNSAVRMWNHLTNVVSTLAGNVTLYPFTNGNYWTSGGYSGDGSSSRLAGLMYPIGLVKDGLGNIYVADLANERIRYLYGFGGKKTTTGIKVTSGTRMQ